MNTDTGYIMGHTSHTDLEFLTCGVGVLLMFCAPLVVVVIALISIVVIPSVRVFAMCVVIIVCVSRAVVGVAGIGVMPAPLPSVGNRNTDVDRLAF